MTMKNLKSQKGFSTILAIFIVCSALLFFFSILSNLVSYREKNYLRIKEALKILNVMEKAAKAVRNSWDQAAALPGGTSAAAIASRMPPLVPDPGCVADCQAISGGITPALCYPNPDSNHNYCIFGNPQMLTGAQLELKIIDPLDPAPTAYIARAKMITDSYIMALLDKLPLHKDTLDAHQKSLVALLFHSSTANAVGRIDDVRVVPPVCPAGVPPGPGAQGCMVCGPASNEASCGLIYACPLMFAGCGTYTGGTNAVFAQEFYITPPGGQK